MSPKRAVGSISIWWLCSVDSFCSLFMHVQVCSASFGRFLQFAALLDHSEASQAAHAEAFADGGESGPAYLAQTLLNFVRLGKSRFLLMIVLSLAPSLARCPQIPQPALQTQSQ